MMRAILAFMVLCSSLQAATFVGMSNVAFEITERNDGIETTLSKIAPVDVVLTTDYSTISWEFSYDVNLAMAGGPEQTFETTFESTGTIRSNGSHLLSFPDANGTASAGTFSLSGEVISFAVTDRIVTATDRHESEPANIVDQRLYSHAFNVAEYPDHVSLASDLIQFSSRFNLGQVSTGPGSFITASIRFVGTSDGDFRNIILTELLPGDFNSSSHVDTADYTVWRDRDGLLAPLMTDYDVWKENFPAWTGNPITVPEPQMLVSGIAALAMAMFARWRAIPQ